MPTWFNYLQLGLLVVTGVVLAFLFFRSHATAGVTMRSAASVSQVSTAKLTEIGKVLDLVDDMVAAGKTREEAKAQLMPVVDAILFGIQKPAA